MNIGAPPELIEAACAKASLPTSEAAEAFKASSVGKLTSEPFYNSSPEPSQMSIRRIIDRVCSLLCRLSVRKLRSHGAQGQQFGQRGQAPTKSYRHEQSGRRRNVPLRVPTETVFDVR